MLGFFRPGFSDADAARLRRIERKLDLVLSHLGIEDPDPAGAGLTDDARRLADAGKKIAAIKAYRGVTGAGLAEAKRAIEEYQSRQ
jgi:hypothetical protein